MAAQMFRIGKPKNGQQQQQQQQQQSKKEVRFELQIAEGEEANEPMVLGTVQERFSGFFELPERCVPFEAEPMDDAGFEQGFPAVFNLATASNFKAMSESADSLGNKDGKANSKQKGSSLFAQHFHQTIREEGEPPPLQAVVVDKSIDETIKNLEPMSAGSCSSNALNTYGNATNSVQSERYALDPVHSDLTVKCLQNVFSRQEQQLIKLFDALACISSSAHISSPNLSTPETVRVLDEAKRNIAHIRPLYLEQFQSEESGRVSWRFARRLVDPFSDGAWTLSPIRRVLDAVQQRNPDIATSDDVEIVRLALLWTVLLLLERPAFFRASVNVSEFFCRLAELYLIGPEVFVYDESIRSCVSILIDTFLVDACQKGLLTLHLNQPIASLDKFAPFFEDLLQRFENFSSGDDNFALLLLIGVYLNASCADGLLMAQTLWSPKRDVVRQIILPEEKVSRLIPYIFAEKCAGDGEQQEQLFGVELAKLIMNYASALREGTVIASRNGAMHAIASEEIKQFTLRRRNQTDRREEQQRKLTGGDLPSDIPEKS
uniref:RPAP1/MINIYO-like TPR repeats domain-containing protein n=1 Tax=Globodera rostochiensis TaxID=31243 RepID=A0A914HII9_GLORO